MQAKALVLRLEKHLKELEDSDLAVESEKAFYACKALLSAWILSPLVSVSPPTLRMYTGFKSLREAVEQASAFSALGENVKEAIKADESEDIQRGVSL